MKNLVGKLIPKFYSKKLQGIQKYKKCVQWRQAE